MEIKLDSDDYLPLNKKIIRDKFLENNKYFPQVFIDESLYKL